MGTASAPNKTSASDDKDRVWAAQYMELNPTSIRSVIVSELFNFSVLQFLPVWWLWGRHLNSPNLPTYSCPSYWEKELGR